MPSSESLRLISLLLAVTSMILTLTSLAGPWTFCSGTELPVVISSEEGAETSYLNGNITYGLWEFCVKGELSGDVSDSLSNDQPGANSTEVTTGDSFVEISSCMYYTAEAYLVLPYYFQCGNGKICKTNRYVKVFEQPPLEGTMSVARIFAAIACVCILFVPCTGFYGHRYEYEESQGAGISCSAVTAVICGAIATGAWSGFSAHGSYWLDIPAKDADEFQYEWAFNVFIAGWVILLVALVFLVLGFKKEEKEQSAKEFEDAMGLTTSTV